MQTDVSGGCATTSQNCSDTAGEQSYLDLIRHILAHGEKRADRTGTGTIAVFAPSPLKFSLANMSLPLLTTKRVFFRGVAEELLWFISGCTDGNELSKKNVNIWEGNGSKEFLESRGLGHRRQGDLGPVYGWQWRHFGAKYVDCDTDYTGQGVDQLAEVIDKIKNNPYDRRIILSAWNPAGEVQPLEDDTIAKKVHYRYRTDGPATMSHVLSVLRVLAEFSSTK